MGHRDSRHNGVGARNGRVRERQLKKSGGEEKRKKGEKRTRENGMRMDWKPEQKSETRGMNPQTTKETWEKSKFFFFWVSNYVYCNYLQISLPRVEPDV